LLIWVETTTLPNICGATQFNDPTATSNSAKFCRVFGWPTSVPVKHCSASQNAKITWGEFSRPYRKELFEGGIIDRRNRTIKHHGQKFTLRLLQQLAKRETVTLMCHCEENELHCHRHILKSVLQQKL
jgi:uncharacterized protein YeaO (DUF488 family)